VPISAETIDLAGRTVIPGLITGPQFYTEANLVAQVRRYASFAIDARLRAA
jgi:hypothetical protein